MGLLLVLAVTAPRSAPCLVEVGSYRPAGVYAPEISDIAIKGTIAFVAASYDAGLRILDIADPTAPIEMERWSDRTGYPILESRRADGLLHFLVRKVGDPKPRDRRTPG